MQGETKKYVETIMYQLGDSQDILKEKEILEREAANEIGTLSLALEEDKYQRVFLEEKLVGLQKSHDLNISKLTKERDHDLAMV
jgi:hypothetical protein